LTRSENLDNNGAIPAQNGAGDMQYGVQQPGAPIVNEILVAGTPVSGGSPNSGTGALGASADSASSHTGDAGATDTDVDASESSASVSTSQGSHTESVAPPPAASQASPVTRLKKESVNLNNIRMGLFGMACHVLQNHQVSATP
jgi:hypothetical protein